MYKFVLFFIFLNFTLFTTSTLSADPHRLYEKEDLSPEADDPWRSQQTKQLSPRFLEALYEKNKQNFTSKEEFLAQTNISKDSAVERIGHFAYNPRLKIGSGEEGYVYLAQHISTNFYSAVKIMGMNNEDVEKGYPLKALQRIGRLYGGYAKEAPNLLDPEESNTLYLFMPLVMGDNLSHFSTIDTEFVKDELNVELTKNEIKYLNWNLNLNLMQALINEIEYCGSKRVVDPEGGSADHVFVSEDKKYITFVDLHCGYIEPGEDKNSQKLAEEINVYYRLPYFRYFLGLMPFLKVGNPYKVKEDIHAPRPVEKFLEKIEIARKQNMNEEGEFFYSLSQLKIDFTELKEEMNDLF